MTTLTSTCTLVSVPVMSVPPTAALESADRRAEGDVPERSDSERDTTDVAAKETGGVGEGGPGGGKGKGDGGGGAGEGGEGGAIGGGGDGMPTRLQCCS